MPSIFGENLFDDLFDDFSWPASRVRFTEPVGGTMKTDVKENEDSYELDIDVPGFKKEDVKAALKDGYLTISASREKNKDEKDKKGKYIRRERFYGSTSRTFYVGKNVTENDIKAKFDNGTLKVLVPKIESKPQVENDHLISIEG